MLLRSSCRISEIHLNTVLWMWGVKHIECHLESLNITIAGGQNTSSAIWNLWTLQNNCWQFLDSGSLHYCSTYDIMSCNCCWGSASAPSCWIDNLWLYCTDLTKQPNQGHSHQSFVSSSLYRDFVRTRPMPMIWRKPLCCDSAWCATHCDCNVLWVQLPS